MTRMMLAASALIALALVARADGTSAYGDFGTEADVVRDDVEPTVFSDASLVFGEVPAASNDCVAAYRKATGQLCGLGRVVSDEGFLTLSLCVTGGTEVCFRGWRSASGVTTNLLASLDGAPAAETLVMPEPGSEESGLALMAVTVNPFNGEEVVSDETAPTNSLNVSLSFGKTEMVVGDAVGMYRRSDDRLCGYGEATTNADGEVRLTLDVQVAAGTKLYFRGWQKSSGSLTNLFAALEGSMLPPALTLAMPSAVADEGELWLELSSELADDTFIIDYFLGADAKNDEANPFSYVFGSTIELKPPTREGYDFVGWVPKDGVITSETIGDLLFSAMWRARDPAPATYGSGTVSTFAISDDMGGGTARIVGVGNLNARSFQLTKYRGNSRAMDGKPPEEDRAYWCFVGGEELVDAEKDAIFENEDDYWCSELTDLNLAYFGGWIPRKTYRTVDAAADKLRATRSPGEEWSTFGWIMENAKAFGLGKKDIRDYVVQFRGTLKAAEFLPFLERQFADGARLVHLDVGGHGVSCCGYSVDDGGELSGLFIIDSDNDMFDGGAGLAPNSVMFCPVKPNDPMVDFPFVQEGDLLVANVMAEEWTALDTAYALKNMSEAQDPFELIVDESGAVVGYYGICEGTVEIPDEVTAIGPGAFRGSGPLKKVVLPESVEFVGADAFADCANLETVVVNSDMIRLMTSAICRHGPDGETMRLPNVQVVSGRTDLEIVGWSVELVSGEDDADDADWAKARFYPADGQADPFAVFGDGIGYAAVPVAPFGYAVRFRENGGTGTMEEQMLTYGREDRLHANRFVNDTQYFQGWTTNAASKDVICLDGASVKNLVTEPDKAKAGIELFAVWSASRLRVRVAFHAQGGLYADGCGDRTNDVAVGEAYAATDDGFPEVPKRPGYIFGGWYAKADPAGGDPVGDGEPFCLDDPNVTDLYAKWEDPVVMFDDRDLRMIRLDLTTSSATNVRIGVSGSAPAAFAVKGLPSGLSFAGNAVSGTPKKSGVFVATVTATLDVRKGFQTVGTMTFVVRNAGERVVVGTCDAEMGKVSGSAVYPSDKSFTLKAKANKGYVFTGWKLENDVAENLFAGKEASESLSDKMPKAGDVELRAEFVTADAVADSIRVSCDDFGFSAEREECSLDVLQGVSREWTIVAEAMLPVASVKVSGLPSGFKFTASEIRDRKTGETVVPANTIYGTPGAQSKWDKKLKEVKPSDVKVTVTTAGKVSKTFVLKMTVHPLPSWVVGTFNGLASSADDGKSAATLTVAASGKVSGTFSTVSCVPQDDDKPDKIVVRKWKYSAVGLNCETFDVNRDTGDVTVDGISFQTVVASGKSQVSVDVAIEKPTGISSSFANGQFVIEDSADGSSLEGSLEMWRNIWKDAGGQVTDRAKTVEGLYTISLEGDCSCGYLTAKVDAKGGIKLAGKLPDGTSVSLSSPLAYDATRGPFVPVFVSPSSYKGGFVSGGLQFDKSDSAKLMYDLVRSMNDDAGLEQKNFSPTAVDCGDSIAVFGSRYEKSMSLDAVLTVNSSMPDLQFYYKSSDGESDDPAYPADLMTSGFTCLLKANDKGKLTAVDEDGTPLKAGTPEKDGDYWYYDVPNIEAISGTLTKSTGLFKGSFVCWYEYCKSERDEENDRRTRVSKKYSFEGIWVQDPSGGPGSLRGFYLSDYIESDGEKTRKFKLPNRIELVPQSPDANEEI